MEQLNTPKPSSACLIATGLLFGAERGVMKRTIEFRFATARRIVPTGVMFESPACATRRHARLELDTKYVERVAVKLVMP